MEKLVKKVAAIHDLSGYGRASFTTIIPVLSSMKIQTCPIPTAILSTHTGFEGFSFIDLTNYMKEHIAHWKRLNLEFECIYSGFLGSPEQIQIVEDFIEDFGEKSELIVVDPVMADNGKLYSTMDNRMVEGMRNLIKKADIITPNYTEMLYLLGMEYKDSMEKEEVKECLRKLAERGPKIVIVTSVPVNNQSSDRKIAVVAYDRENDIYWKVTSRYIPVAYTGTGDAYASVVIGSLLQGDSLPIAMERGVQFISQSIMESYGYNYPKREGILLEKMLDILKMPMIFNNYERL